MNSTVEMKIVLVGSRRIGKDTDAELMDMIDHSIIMAESRVVNVMANKERRTHDRRRQVGIE